MTNHEARNKVKQFTREFEIKNINCALLKAVMVKQGYTMVEFRHIANEADVESLIKALNLTEMIMRTEAFTYADQNCRIVFVHQDLSDEEKLIALAHEEGHIYCGHMTVMPILGKNVQEEYEANEFVHYLLHRNMRKTGGTKKQVGFLLACLLVLIAVLFAVRFRQTGTRALPLRGQMTDACYVTVSGHKYHDENCIFVKNKTNVRRMTAEEYESGLYEPCGICLPGND